MGFVKEFKEFAMRGNVVDMAVGIIIGGAFGKIIASLVGDIAMPLINPLIPGGDWKGLKIGNNIMIGNFIGAVIDFLVIALVIFMMIKAMNMSKKKQEAPPAPAPPEPSTEEKLLGEIRDLLKNK